jgi:hypothetical protein
MKRILERYKITVEIKQEDIKALCEVILQRRKLRSAILGVVMAAFFVMIFTMAGVGLYLSIGLSILFAALFAGAMIKLTRSNYSRQFNTNKNFKHPIEYHMYNDHYIVKTASSESKVDFATRYDIVQDDEYIFIFHMREMASVIPKRYLNAEELTFFNEIITRFRRK